jgi:hypothetical protein
VADRVVADENVVDLVVADMTDTTDVAEITDANIVTDIDALSDQLDDEIDSKILPRYRRGMQNINAVVSSAYPIGEALLYAMKDRDVAKHGSGLRIDAAKKNADIRLANENLHLEVRKANLAKDIEVGISNLLKEVEIDKANMNKDLELGKINIGKDVDIGKVNLLKELQQGEINSKTELSYKQLYLSGVSQMLQIMMQRISWEESYMRTVVEANRIKIVAKREQNIQDAEIDARDALWDLEAFQYGSNLLAGIGGGTAVSSVKGPSTAQSAIGGALVGGSAGYMAANAGVLGPAMAANPLLGLGVGAALGIASAFL